MKTKHPVQSATSRLATPESHPGSGALWNLPGLLSNSGVSFPLTPALSLGERENPRLRCDKSRRAEISSDGRQGTLSPRERAGARGNRAHAVSMVSGGLRLTALSLLPAFLLALASCSSPPPPPPPVAQASAASSGAAPALIDAGVIVETATGMVTVQSIDVAARTLVLKRADGLTATFKAGPEIRRFNQLKVGDQIMSTVTDNSTIFVLKEKLTPSAAASQAVVRTPEGASVGGIIVNAINIDAKVLDVDLDHRTVLLQYGPTQTRSVSVRPTVDLSQVAVNDTVLVRGTQTISIMVGNP